MIAISKGARERGGKVIAQCPACAELGNDRSGEHLIIRPDGRFGCVAFPGDHEHRRRIFALIGVKDGDRADLVASIDREAYAARRRSEAAARAESERLKGLAAKNRVWILERFAWPWADIFKASLLRLDGDPLDDWRHVMRLLPDDGLIWCGYLDDSADERHHANFKPRDKWLAFAKQPGPRVALASFTGGPSRCAAAVQSAPLILVEADEALGFKPTTEAECEANREACAALVRWLRDAVGMHLVALIDSGNKSLHAWFGRPPDEVFQQLVAMAPGLGIDAGVLRNPSTPARLPGCIHQTTRRPARLLYCEK